jgi:hypothetical protein
LTEVRGQDDDPDSDLVPISVQNIQIFELDQNNKVVAQTVRTGTFVDGSNFTYTSIIATETEDINPVSLPRGLQLVITGLNEMEESVVNTYIILYTNDCGIFPLLFVGQTAGWTIFVSGCVTMKNVAPNAGHSLTFFSLVAQSDLGPPPHELCPAAPSNAPSQEPTLTPTTEETEEPTEEPTDAPVVGPTTPAPAPAPVAPTPVEPTDAPTTEAPVVSCPPVHTRPPGKGKGKGKGKAKTSKSKGKGMAKSSKAKYSTGMMMGMMGKGKGGGPKKKVESSSKRKDDYYGYMEKLSKTRRLRVGERPDGCPEPEPHKREYSKSSGEGGMMGKSISKNNGGKGGMGMMMSKRESGSKKGSKGGKGGVSKKKTRSKSKENAKISKKAEGGKGKGKRL